MIPGERKGREKKSSLVLYSGEKLCVTIICSGNTQRYPKARDDKNKFLNTQLLCDTAKTPLLRWLTMSQKINPLSKKTDIISCE